MNQRLLPRLLVHWSRFLPYHVARLEASRRLLADEIEVIGFETARRDTLYSCVETTIPENLPVHVVFNDERPLASIPKNELFTGIWRELDLLEPSAIAINGYSFDDSLACLLWAKQNAVPAILMSESWALDFRRRGWREYLKSLIVRQFSAALVGGTYHRQYIESLGIPARKVSIGYDAVDNGFFEKRASLARSNRKELLESQGLPERFFLASGRFVERKNFQGLLEAFAAYRRQVGSFAWDLVLMGDGPMRESLEQRIAQPDLTGHVRLVPFQQAEKVAEMYGLANAYICPSLNDQWGLVINEAMAAGLPVLVSNRCGSAIDLVHEGVNGHTFDPMRTGDICSALRRLSMPGVDLDAMGAASAIIVDAFSPQAFAFGLRSACAIGMEQAPSRVSSLLGKVFVGLGLRSWIRREKQT